MQLRIEAISAKQGVNKNNKAYTMLTIRSGDKSYSTFVGRWNQHWKVGSVVEADVEVNGKYLNLVEPKDQKQTAKAGDITLALATINTKLDRILAILDEQEPGLGAVPYNDTPPPTDDDRAW